MSEMTAPMLVFPERRSPGRPRVSQEEMTHLTTYIPVSQYERLKKQADQQRLSLQEFLRRRLR